MPAVPRHRAHRLAPGRIGLDGHVPVVRGQRPGHPRPRRPGRAPRRSRSAPGRRRLANSALDEGPKWPCRRLRLARAGRWARGMPPFARLLALSITVALAALGAAPAAQAAVLPLAHSAVAVVDSPHDGVVAGGDTLLITETLHNSDSVPLTGLTATLATQTAGVTIDQGSSAYPDVAAGADAANTTPLQVTLDRVAAVRDHAALQPHGDQRDGERRGALHGRHRGAGGLHGLHRHSGRHRRDRGQPAQGAVVGQLRGHRARERPGHRRGGAGHHRQPQPSGHQPPLAGAQSPDSWAYRAAGQRRARGGGPVLHQHRARARGHPAAVPRRGPVHRDVQGRRRPQRHGWALAAGRLAAGRHRTQ